MTPGIVGLVETSNNLSSIRTEADTLKIVCSSRSSNAPALWRRTLDWIQAISRMAGATAEKGEGYHRLEAEHGVQGAGGPEANLQPGSSARS